MVPPETFFGLTAMQVQGWAAIASVVLTTVLVATTIVYVILTRAIARAAIRSHQHELLRNRDEQVRKRQIVGMVVTSMVAELGAMMPPRNLPNEAVTKTLPDRILWLSVPNEILMAYAQSVGADVFLKVGTVLRNIEAADAGLNRMRPLRDLPQLVEIANNIQSCCRVGKRVAEECLALVRQAAEAEGEADLSEHFRDALAQLRSADRKT